MNKIYKLVWSKTRNMYIAVCEFAKSHTKSPKSGVMSRALVAGVLACVLGCGAVMPVYAAAYSAGGGTATISTDIAIGGSSKADGHSNSSSNAGEALAIGQNAQALGYFATALGGFTLGQSDGSIVIGDAAAIGNTSSNSAIAIGTTTTAIGQNAMAFGSHTYANGANSVALGAWSVANESNVVSFGHKADDIYTLHDSGGFHQYTAASNLYRRLINVADGIDDTDVATWGQTKVETRPADNGNYVAGFSAS